MTVKIAYHPNDKDSITFREDDHSYIDNHGIRYVSGTTVVKNFFPEFDTIAVSEKCSKNPENKKYFGRDPEEIRAKWKEKGQRFSKEGDNTHYYAECLMEDITPLPDPISERCKLLFKQVEKVVKILKKKYVLIGTEFIIFSPKLKWAGMIDLLMYDPVNHVVLIDDYKQNEEIDTVNTFQYGLKPIEHLQNTKLNKYTLQLSLYEEILRREGYFPEDVTYQRKLFHILPDTVKVIILEDYNYEILEMLKIK